MGDEPEGADIVEQGTRPVRLPRLPRLPGFPDLGQIPYRDCPIIDTTTGGLLNTAGRSRGQLSSSAAVASITAAVTPWMP
jgi:hypothetical protein